MLRRTLLALAGSQRVERLASTMPVSSGIVARFVAGQTTARAVAATAALVGDGLQVTIDHLGEDALDRTRATRAVAAYLEGLEALADAGLTPAAEVSVKLSAVGQALTGGHDVALDNARRICEAARAAATTVTLDMEDHTTTDSTLDILQALRKEFPGTGAVVQSYLRRTESDCAALTAPGSRVRLCKGAYAEPDEVAFQDKHDVDLSYVRCLNVLMAGKGRPMVATHDPRLIAIAAERAARYGRMPESWEYQMLYGTRPTEQKRLVDLGHTVRVYVPFGQEWYGYLMRRLAERPANVWFVMKNMFKG